MDFSQIQKKLKKLWKTHPTVVALVVFAVLIAIFYGNTLGNGFIYDDFQQVESNEYIQSLRYLPKTITGCIWEFAHGQCEGRTHYYRPVQFFSYLLTYQISSGAWFFHLVNLVYFFGIVSLIFLLVLRLFKDTLWAFVSALIFLIHPINSEVVNWVSGVPDLSFALFSLLAVFYYVKYRQENKAKQITFIQKYRYVMIAVLFSFFALLSKEPAILLPAVFVLLDLLVFRHRVSYFFQRKEALVYGSLAMLTGIYLLARIAVIGGLSKPGLDYYGPFSFTERLFTSVTLFGAYVGKLFFPYPIQFSYPFEKMGNILSLEFILSFLGLVGLGILVVVSYRKRMYAIPFAIIWSLFFLSPVLFFFNALGDSIFSERYLFVPMIGFALFGGYVFVLLWKRKWSPKEMQKRVRIVLGGFLILLSILSFAVVSDRNGDWKDNQTFFRSSLQGNPEAHPLRYNLSVLLRQQGNFEESKKELETIESMSPRAGTRAWDGMIMVYLHLGDYYRDRIDNSERALEYYKQSLSIANEWDGDWKGSFAQDRIGSLYATNEEYIKAIPYFCSLLQGGERITEKEQKFNLLIETITSKYEDNISEKYDDIIKEGNFEKRSERRVLHEGTACNDVSCTVLFQFQFQEFEIVLPFLIAAKGNGQEAIKIENAAFNPATGQAQFQIANEWEDKDIIFIFPTCEGVYYETKISK